MQGGATREVARRGVDRQEAHGLRERDDARGALASLELGSPGGGIIETRDSGNVIVLGSGTFGGARLTKPYGRVIGLGDTVFDRQVIVEAYTVFRGLHFRSSPLASDRNNASALVVVTSGSALFQDCIFEKDAADPMSLVGVDRKCYVVVEDGAMATFSGCLFRGVPTTAGFVVNHVAGLATDVIVIGCHNLTGLGHNGVGVTLETP